MFARLTPKLREKDKVVLIAVDIPGRHFAVKHHGAAIGIIEKGVILNKGQQFRLGRKQPGAISDLQNREGFTVFTGLGIGAGKLGPVAFGAWPQIDHLFEQDRPVGIVAKLGINQIQKIVMRLTRLALSLGCFDRPPGGIKRRAIIWRRYLSISGGQKIIRVRINILATSTRRLNPLIETGNGRLISFFPETAAAQ